MAPRHQSSAVSTPINFTANIHKDGVADGTTTRQRLTTHRRDLSQTLKWEAIAFPFGAPESDESLVNNMDPDALIPPQTIPRTSSTDRFVGWNGQTTPSVTSDIHSPVSNTLHHVLKTVELPPAWRSHDDSKHFAATGPFQHMPDYIRRELEPLVYLPTATRELVIEGVTRTEAYKEMRDAEAAEERMQLEASVQEIPIVYTNTTPGVLRLRPQATGTSLDIITSIELPPAATVQTPPPSQSEAGHVFGRQAIRPQQGGISMLTIARAKDQVGGMLTIPTTLTHNEHPSEESMASIRPFPIALTVNIKVPLPAAYSPSIYSPTPIDSSIEFGTATGGPTAATPQSPIILPESITTSTPHTHPTFHEFVPIAEHTISASGSATKTQELAATSPTSPLFRTPRTRARTTARQERVSAAANLEATMGSLPTRKTRTLFRQRLTRFVGTLALKLSNRREK